MLSSLMKHAVYRKAIAILWVLVLIGLPLTSFPILTRLTGAIVAPFSAIPIVLLLIIWLVPYLIERGQLPAEIVPLVYFILIALILSAMAYFLNGTYARGRDFFHQSLNAFLSLGTGVAFYLIFAAYPSNPKRLRQTFMLIYLSGGLLILWSLLEVGMLRVYGRVQDLPGWMMAIRSALAVQSPTVMFTNRVTGFAYEPSWFVRQFNLVLFPIWLSAVYQRESIFKFRLWKFQVEDFLLGLGLIVFGFSSPRIGMLAFLGSLAYLSFLLFRRLHRWLTAWFLRRWQGFVRHLTWTKIVLAVLMVVIIAVLAGSAMIGYVVVASRWDNRYALLLQESTLKNLNIFPLTETRLIYLARNLAFFERMIYWFGGWHIFNDYPFGVGLGNAGFYFLERMHGAGYESLEMRNLIYRAGYLPNTKNMWTRLLAETGFIGLAVFLVWLYLLWRSAGLTRKSEDKMLRLLGLAGQLFLVAYLFECFSIDSFAMPYQWVMTGLISAGGWYRRRALLASEKGNDHDLVL